MGRSRSPESSWPSPGNGLSRRSFLRAASALAGAVAWRPAFRIAVGGPGATLPEPRGFPPGVELYQEAYENWSGEIRVADVWTAAPERPEDVAELATWAHRHGWRIRAKGRCHGWSPLVLPRDATGAGCLLVDLSRHLTAVAIQADGAPASVTAQAGVSLDDLLEQLGAAGLGFAALPAPGSVTLGGVLAVGGHGAAVPAQGEAARPGCTFGSLSNAVLALAAVVWDAGAGRYRLRAFDRDDPDIGPLLVHLGRACVVAATLQVAPDLPLRCLSRIDIPAGTLFAPPERAGAESFQAFVEASGRVEAIWFPFTRHPWLKVWTPAPRQPWTSRRLEAPYAYTFANWVTPAEDRFLQDLVAGLPTDTPGFQRLEMAAVAAGLAATGTADLWGSSRHVLRYVQPSTLRLGEQGYAVLTRRRDLQRVISDYCRACADLLGQYRDRGEYPLNGPLEIRVTGLDRPEEVPVPGAATPWLSALRPWPGRPWDCAVWLNNLTCPGTPGAEAFRAELEARVRATYVGDYAAVRMEWAKGWGYTGAGAWTCPEILDRAVPGSFPGTWEAARAALDALDPGRVFSNPLLDRLFPASGAAG